MEIVSTDIDKDYETIEQLQQDFIETLKNKLLEQLYLLARENISKNRYHESLETDLDILDILEYFPDITQLASQYISKKILNFSVFYDVIYICWVWSDKHEFFIIKKDI